MNYGKVNMTDIAIEDTRAMLELHNQQHLLDYYGELTPARQESLREQIAAIDFHQLDELIDRYVRTEEKFDIPTDIAPPCTYPAKPSADTEQLYAEAAARGQQLLAEGKVAAFVVAGGQGTRLGYEGPKGCFEGTPVARKPLFQVFAEQILAASKRAGKPVPWYIMTSPLNDAATRAFFRQHNFFGMNPDDVFFFPQGTMPAMDVSGKILMKSKSALALNPDGHGGSLRALKQSGALDDMGTRGIELISYFQVDNPLVRCIDPLFLGLHDLKGAEMSAKALPKCHPMEKLGNFCVVDGKVTVIEYSDMPDELAMATTDDGRLKFSAGSIAIHILSKAFVEKLNEGGRCQLPFHRAVKKVTCLDEAGNPAEAMEANAVKLEMFVFDALPLASGAVILETDRSEEFSPIKNAEGVDSVVTSLHDQVRRAAGWLERAGITVPRDADGQIAAAIEISPLWADSADELATRADTTLTISSGQQLYLGSRGQMGGTK